MPRKGRDHEGVPARPSATSGAEALTDDDLTQLGLDDLIQLPLSTGAAFPALHATQPAVSSEDQDPADFSSLSLEQLMSLSISGDDQPEDEEEEDEDSDDDETASDESDEDGESEEVGAEADGSPGLLQELQVDTVEWLSQEDDLSLLATGHGFFDQGVATAGSLGSLRFGGPPTGLGNQPVPTALPAGTSNPIQTWFTPFAIDLTDGTIGETWSVADPVGTVMAFGTGAQVSYVLIDDAGGQFAIDSATGNVTIVSGPFDFTAQTSHTIVVEAADGAQTVQQTFTIQVSPSDLDAQGLPGDDVLTGANGNTADLLHGGAGNDTLSGLNGDDELHGGSGSDLLIGGNHDDTLFGGSGGDVLQGGNQDDSLYGGTGDDELYGENHDDALFGGGGADELYGGDGSDFLSGDGGSDWLDGGSGGDSLTGGADDDVLVWDAADLLIDGGDGNDELLVLAGDLDLTAFGGGLASLEIIDLLSDTGANTLSLTAADVLDMTDNGLLTVLGDAKDSVNTEAGWALSHTDEDGYQLYVQTLGQDIVGLLLGPDVQIDPQDGG